MKKKILTVFGTRPEAIKLAPLIKEIERHPDEFISLVCVTAQHREMLDQVMSTFDIKPDYDLKIMKESQDLFDITSMVLLGMRDVLKKEQPSYVIVQGDTTTSFAAALAAFYCQIPVAHLEAGLRTYKKYSPFPEEINRKLTTSLGDLHFAPTEISKNNLLKENIEERNIFVTGNTVIDALLMMVEKNYQFTNTQLKNIDFSKKIILVTGHRRENFGKPFENFCYALKDIAELEENISIVYPVHLNPNVQKPVFDILKNLNNVHLIHPLEYKPFIQLMNKSYLIITDSGGVQEEAPSLGKPVLVTRDVTERPEAVTAGTVKLVGTSREKIVKETMKILKNDETYKIMSKAINPYGDGKAAKRIVSILSGN